MSEDEADKLDPAEQMLSEVPGAELSEEEADAIFEEAWNEQEHRDAGDSDSVRGSTDRSRPRSRTGGLPKVGGWLRPLAVAGVLAVVSIGVWMVTRTTDSPVDQMESYEGIKSPDGVPEVELIPIVGSRRGGDASIEGRAKPGSALSAEVRLLFRYRLSREASVALMGAGDDTAPEVLWRSETPRPGRELEIRDNGRALALDPSRYNGRFRLMLVAGDRRQLSRVDQLEELTEPALRAICRNCGFDIVAFRAPPE